MTYPEHILLQFGGRLFDIEQWSCGLRIDIFAGTLGTDAGANETWSANNIEDVADDVSAWFTRAESYTSNKARLDYVKLNSIGTNGKYTSADATNVVEFPLGTSPVGTYTPGYPQNTAVVSLLTDLSRGPAHRGRCYPPTGQIGMTTAGHMAQGQCEYMAGSFAQLIGDLNNQPGLDADDPRVVVVSKLGSPGPRKEVTSVSVGDVIDTQRRRRESMPELYWAAAIP